MHKFSIRYHTYNRTRRRRCIWKIRSDDHVFNRPVDKGVNLRNVVATLNQFNDPLALLAPLKARFRRCFHEGSIGGVLGAIPFMGFSLACDARPFLTNWALGFIANGCFLWNKGYTVDIVAIGSI